MEFGCVTIQHGPDRVYLYPHYQFLFNETPDVIYGKPLYVETRRFLNAHPRRQLGGRSVVELKIERCGAGVVPVQDDKLVKLAEKIFAGLIWKAPHHFASNYSATSMNHVTSCISPREALSAMSADVQMQRVIEYVTSSFRLDSSALGLTGSSLISLQPSPNDHDIVIYCDVEDAVGIRRRITSFHKDGLNAPAYGIDWAYRFRHPELGVFCIFLAYFDASDCPIDIHKYKVKSVNHEFEVTISNDQYAGYSPSIYKTQDKNYPWLIILGTAGRGSFRVGDNIRGTGDLVEIAVNGETSLCHIVAFPFKQINSMRLVAEHGNNC